MAVVLVAGLGFLGTIAYSQMMQDRVYQRVSMKDAVSDRAYQIAADKDLGIRVNQNVRSCAAVISEEVPGIIRSDDYGDIHNVWENALDYTRRAREKNKALGLMNFDFNDRSTVLLPSLNSKVLQMTVPNPSVYENYKLIPNAFVMKSNGKPYVDDQAWRYRDPYAENVTPFNYGTPLQNADVAKFGNPWGMAGVFKSNLREGGGRLKGRLDYDPKRNSVKGVTFKIPIGTS